MVMASDAAGSDGDVAGYGGLSLSPEALETRRLLSADFRYHSRRPCNWLAGLLMLHRGGSAMVIGRDFLWCFRAFSDRRGDWCFLVRGALPVKAE